MPAFLVLFTFVRYNYKTMKIIKKPIKLAAALAPAVLFAAPMAANSRPHLQGYVVRSSKITGRVRLVLLADFHNDYSYGPGGQQIAQMVQWTKPDAILLAGDIGERRTDNHYTFGFVRRLTQIAPCFYASGNHEQKSGHLPQMKAVFRRIGAHVLQGDCRPLLMCGQTLQVCGVDDPAGGRLQHLQQTDAVAAQSNPELFRVLVAHRPEYMPFYATYGYDLIVAGHAHGGQWRLPPYVNGLFSPDQGLLPKIAGGEYHFANSTVVVSRGLTRANTFVPRIFNRPEVVVIDLLPQ